MCKEARVCLTLFCTVKFCVTPVMSLPIYLLWYCAIPAVPRAMRCVSGGGLWKSLGTLYSTFKTSSRNDTMVWFQLCATCGLSLLLVLALFRRFFSRFSGFPSSGKTNISKFQFDQARKPAWKPAKAHAASSRYIAIYLIYCILFNVCFCLHSSTQTRWVRIKLKMFDSFNMC